MALISFQHVTYYYPETEIAVLKDVTLSVDKGEFVGVVGPTGAGKTTLCLAMSGLIPSVVGGRLEGNVEVGGLNTKEVGIGGLMASAGVGKSLVAMTFQDPESQIVGMTVEEDLAFGLENAGLDSEEIERRIDEALDAVRMREYRRAFSYGLSGGQKQRVAIAVALAMKPEILILDEPTSELDPIGRQEIFSVIRRLKEESSLTVIIVEHEIEELVKYADKVLVLAEGQVQIVDTPERVFSGGALLTRVGVRAPEVTEFGHLLQQKLGLPNRVLLTEDQAERYVRHVLKSGGR